MAMVNAISTIPGFEARFMGRLKETVAALPAATAELSFDKKSSGGPLLPYFRIAPLNPRSAAVRGFFADGEGITFTIGRGTSGEIYVTRKSEEKAKTQEDKFFAICKAVFTTHFSEKLIYNSHGKLIWWQSVLTIHDRKIPVRGRQFLWWLSPSKITEDFSHEPYY